MKDEGRRTKDERRKTKDERRRMKDEGKREARGIEGIVCFICLPAVYHPPSANLAHWFIGTLIWQTFEKTCQVFKT